jgi:hypothetical protein
MASGTINNTASETSSTDTTITDATIDNSLYRYWMTLYPMDADHAVSAVKIKYLPLIPGDLAATYNLTLAKSILDTAGSTGSISYKVQVNGDAGDKFGELGSGTITAIVFSNASHTHSLGYGIYEEALTGPSVGLYSGEDDGSMTLKGTYTSNQIELDLTNEVSNVGAGKWMNLQFRPNKNMRIDANAYVQIFIKSE